MPVPGAGVAGGRPRLQQYLAAAGLGSRRRMEVWIRAGRVRVNGQPAVLGQRVDPERDRVEVDGRAVVPAGARQYWLLHKPAGFTTTLADPHARHTVRELFPPGAGRLFPVGRLDRETTGVLLLTDDGGLAHRLMHPRFRVEKVYHLWVARRLVPADLAPLVRPLPIGEGEMAQVDAARLLAADPGGSLVEIRLHEGRKREVRRLAAVLGWPIRHLTRVRYAGLDLTGLPAGAVRPLTAAEVAALKALVREPPTADAAETKEGKRPHAGRT